MSLTIKLTSNAREAMKKLEDFPNRLSQAVVAEMNRLNQEVIGEITAKRLTGKGPFPVDEHRLGVVTARLRKSLNASNAQATQNRVESRIGSNVVYAGVHEFGFDGTVFVNSHERKPHKRLKEIITTKLGKQRRKFTKIGGSIVTGHGREVHMPARAPIKTGLDDYEPKYGEGISRAIVEAWDRFVREGTS